MKRALYCASALACGLVVVSASAQAPAEVTLTRFDCGGTGTPTDIARFSDTNAYDGKKLELTASCYLVKHGDQYLVWDTGYPAAGSGGTPNPASPKVSLVDQLKQLNLTPDKITYVGISHYHGDHTGQAASFPQATLLIGKGDWDTLQDPNRPQNANPAPLANWITGGGKAEQVPKDKDVFGDGTVVMLDTPGHTPGHHSLLVKLKGMGNVILSGDLAHLRENYDNNGVPSFNTNRADSLASLDRVRQIAKNLKATVIVQHDARDVSKLPAFPNAAK